MKDPKDLFYLDKVFPEPVKIFSGDHKKAEEIIKAGLIILDTNILLVPYNANQKSVDNIKEILKSYKSNSRLFIPARVAREFASNRASYLSKIFLHIRQKNNSLNSINLSIDDYPILDNHPDYTQLLENYKSVKNEVEKCRKNLINLENHIQSLTWDDNVSKAYREIFTEDLIVEVNLPEKELEENLRFRTLYKVAPGFKDAGKLDEGIGDLIIWQTILEIAKEKENDVIFVTNEKKADWFYKQDNTGLYPKFELFDEFRRKTNGKSISIIDFVTFLKLSLAEKETIQEIQTTINNLPNIEIPTENNASQARFTPVSELMAQISESTKFLITFTIDNEEIDAQELRTLIENHGGKNVITINLTPNDCQIIFEVRNIFYYAKITKALSEVEGIVFTAQPIPH